MRHPSVKENPVKRALAKSERVFGVWLLVPSPVPMEIAGYAGLDFAVIDAEHGAFNDETLQNMIRAGENVDLAVFVKVLENHPALIMKALDLGADGVMIPHVCTRAEAEAAVRAARNHPEGFRGQMTELRVDGYGTIQAEEYTARSNEQVMVMLVIEDVAGVRNLPEILATPGVDAIVVGMADLAQAMGFTGQAEHPEVLATRDRIRAATEKAGLIFYGDRMVEIGTDHGLFLEALVRALRTAKAAPGRH
jgi:2-keto-3-deoxy-L-rhamnonate aldolase RhmA